MKRILLLIFLFLLLGTFVLANKDINRHPVTGIVERKFMDDNGMYHFIVLVGDKSVDIGSVPHEAYSIYNRGDEITVTVRAGHYRYLGDYQ